MIIQQPLSRDARVAQHLSKLRLIDHGWDMIPRNPITLPLLKALLQFLDYIISYISYKSHQLGEAKF
jgi:hypothetical protein